MTTLAVSPFRLWTPLSYSIHAFFFKPAKPLPLAALRIGVSCILLVQAFLIRPSFFAFFAPSGLVQKEVGSVLQEPSMLNLAWAVEFLKACTGLSENLVLTGFGLSYVLSLCFLLGGLFTRRSAFFTWLLHWSFANTGFCGSYGADMYAHLFLFYFMWIPCGNALSLDRFFGRASGEPSFQARLGLRVLQLHMCISYLASGLEKASGTQWWNGEVMWRALTTPGYSISDFHWLAAVPVLPMVSGIVVMVVEIFYCVMDWPQKTRLLWVVATCALHLGIAIFLRLHIFGLLMCIPTIALFAISFEPVNLNDQRQKKLSRYAMHDLHAFYKRL